MKPENQHTDPRQTNRVKELRDIKPGTVFHLPGSRVKWRKLPGKAEKCGWLWFYQCTDGRYKKLIWGGKTIFINKPAAEN